MTSEPRRDLTGQVLDRRFRVLGRLGRGGMSSVWLVEHTQSLQSFALKVLDPELVSEGAADRLLSEARILGALRSRHTVRLIDAQVGYVHEGTLLPFLVMELLEGTTLEELLGERRRLRPGELAWLMTQVAVGLAEAHERGIVHRDIKPSNLFVARDEAGAPIVKLCDFGVAKLLDSARERLSVDSWLETATGSVLGTPRYLAPELLRGSESAVPATDQWAVALVCFRSLTGSEYFAGARSMSGLVLAIAEDPLAKPSSLSPDLPAAFDAWFLRSVSREPGGRFRDVETQLRALVHALGDPEPLAIDARYSAPPTVSERAPRAASNGTARALMKGFALAACAVWACSGLYWLTRSRARALDAAAQGSLGLAAEAPSRAASATRPSAPNAPAASHSEARAAAAARGNSTASAASGRTSARGAGDDGRRAPSAVTTRRASALVARRGYCTRSSECESGVCVAEACQ